MNVNTIAEFEKELKKPGLKILCCTGNTFELFVDNDLEGNKKEGHIYRIEMFPKGYNVENVHRYDYDDEKKSFATLSPRSIKIDNKRGLKSLIASMEQVLEKYKFDHNQVVKRYAGMTCFSHVTFYGQDVFNNYS